MGQSPVDSGSGRMRSPAPLLPSLFALQKELKNLGLFLLLTPAMVGHWTLEGLEDLGTLGGFLDSTLSSSRASVTSPPDFLPALALTTRAPRRSALTSVTSLESGLLGMAVASQGSSTPSLTLLAATLASRLAPKVVREL